MCECVGVYVCIFVRVCMCECAGVYVCASSYRCVF